MGRRCFGTDDAQYYVFKPDPRQFPFSLLTLFYRVL